MGTKRLSQKDVVIQYMKEHGSITSIQAIEDLHITRLADVIFRIKKDGVEIESYKKMVDTFYGKTEVAVYRLV